MHILAYLIAALVAFGTLIILAKIPSPQYGGWTLLHAYIFSAGFISVSIFLIAGRAVQLLEVIAKNREPVQRTEDSPPVNQDSGSDKDNQNDEIIENPDGTFSIEGRTYKSRASAKAYLEHFGSVSKQPKTKAPAKTKVPEKPQEGGDNPIGAVEVHLKNMGYDLTPYGAGVALLELESGYNAVETASHISLTTLAFDVREAGTDIEKLMQFVPHAMTLLEVLKSYKDKGMMNLTQWQNDANAIARVSTVDEHQEEWIEKVLSDPIAGKERLATSRVDYRAS